MPSDLYRLDERLERAEQPQVTLAVVKSVSGAVATVHMLDDPELEVEAHIALPRLSVVLPHQHVVPGKDTSVKTRHKHSVSERPTEPNMEHTHVVEVMPGDVVLLLWARFSTPIIIPAQLEV